MKQTTLNQPRVNPVPPEKAPAEVKKLYDTIQQKLHALPNIFKNMGHSPAVLKGYLSLSEAASHTGFSPQLREQIALIIGQTNQCDYCLSAHTTIGKSLGLDEQSIIQARKGHASNSKEDAILQFCKQIVESRGHVTDEQVAKAKNAGVTDTELVEIILLVSLNTFTNYFNHITATAIDFPPAPPLH